MPDTNPPDLFAAAGITLDTEFVRTAPKRPRKPKPPTPAERAAAGRLEGARRLRPTQAPGQRARVGPPRDLAPAPVMAFPLARNARVVAELIERLQADKAGNLDAAYDRETRNLEKRLVRRGLHKQSARRCAMDVVHAAYSKTVSSQRERQE
ncbi:DUF6074 family protein [Methylobacterium sp. J-030]|uniref:DUF6074 family protein n=1 Tax=Methylobacterium sp. J-030 TaxID=2836627 RepID=UPI001FB9C85C|nr:DUF6074 family protein [Methylobacterium sp. J-030]MCJ2067941.1 DUF6074 family protein [Methylobacterium sp. J-030]